MGRIHHEWGCAGRANSILASGSVPQQSLAPHHKCHYSPGNVLRKYYISMLKSFRIIENRAAAKLTQTHTPRAKAMQRFAVVLLVLVAAAVSSAYAQCDSVEEKQMVSCAKRNLKNCPAVIRECLRDRGANHTAKCLRDSCKFPNTRHMLAQ